MTTDSVSSQTFKLERYYLAIVATTLATLFFFAFLTRGYGEYFPWITHPTLHFWLLIAVALGQAILFLLQRRFKRKLFFEIDRYNFIVFFFLILYAEGGVASPFVWILIFPLLVSVVDLDARATKEVGILITIGLALFIFATPDSVRDPVFLIQHLIRVILFGLIAFYLHKIVKETLWQKYEKEEAKRKFSELIELDRVKSDFITVVSHQLRTPLSGLRWALGNLLDEPVPLSEAREIISESKKNVDRAMSIVNELIETSASRAGGLFLEKGLCDGGELLREAADDLRFLARQKEVALDLEVSSPALLLADAKKLKAAFTNILDNAIRYAPKSKVRVAALSQGGRFSVSVSDTGIGIPADDVPHVFDRFYRAKNAISLEPNESGVGLYIAKQVIERHGGSIAVSSQEGKGTVVAVTLPLGG